jgi:hypothetical protein
MTDILQHLMSPPACVSCRLVDSRLSRPVSLALTLLELCWSSCFVSVAAVGIEAESDKVEMLLKEVEGKSVDDIISAGILEHLPLVTSSTSADETAEHYSSRQVMARAAT